MSSKSPTAYWPTPSLIRSLSRAGWGELGGHSMKGVRATLRALVDLLPDKSGMGKATAWQLAHAAGQSDKWTRRCLGLLEDIGVITWHRGGIINGRPAPSYFQIIKTKLVELIHAARPASDTRRKAHQERTNQRIATLKPGVNIVHGKQKRRSKHVELGASLRPPYGGTSSSVPTVRGVIDLNREQTERAQRAQATLFDQQERAKARAASKDAIDALKTMLRGKGILCRQ
ncbi:hypothetical protein [Trueperella abortisuis]|uniref:hypothetical protein n=1 Tax=Trueperella abortisuis TaxID=445930 RepID=UPI002892B690|nr:hypothetical protein [Trueperella abortisuis]